MQTNKINYPKNIKRQNPAKKPKKQRWPIQLLAFTLALILRLGIKRKLVKIGMKDLKKQPYLLLVNHMSFLDFPIAIQATAPRKVNNVVAIGEFDIKAGLFYIAGCWPKRKFVGEVHTVRNVLHCLRKYKSVVTIYPEARYTQTGTNAVLPDSLGKLIKLAKVPVVTLIFNGHHLINPCWGDTKYRKEVPVLATMKPLLDTNQIAQMSADEINLTVNKAFVYDEYKYWQQSGFKIKYKNRAAGLHHLLYKCPECLSEYKMTSGGCQIACSQCNSAWELTQEGYLNCKTGQTRFNHIPDWCEWERGQVRSEIEQGTYKIEGSFETFSQPKDTTIIKLGKTDFVHNNSGFRVKGHYNGQDFEFIKPPSENYSIQTEYNYARFKGKHFF
ncbi:MAG: hypothetical protein FWD86_01190, partial [Firmicutes bacterium]|nr:hypothetical protein [Bacillota bacterium]